MPKQLWQTFDGRTFEERDHAESHEDELFAAFVNDPGSAVSVSALWEESSIKEEFYSNNHLSMSEADTTERSVLRGILERLFRKQQGTK